MRGASVIAGILAAIKLPAIMWNTFKNGGFETDEAAVEDAKEFSKKLDSLRTRLEVICKRDPEFSLCADFFNGAYDYDKWGEKAPVKLDKTLDQRTFSKKNTPSNVAKGRK